MSVYIAGGGGEPAFVASNTGWGAFGAWVDSLDPAPFNDLVHLREYGWSEPAKAVRDQLAAALKESPPADPAVRATAGEVAEALADLPDDEAVVVSGGFSPEGAA